MSPVMLLLLVLAGCTVRAETYVIAEGTSYGWVVVDSSRPGCSPLDGGFVRRIAIPKSRYVCTSSPVFTGTAHSRYYLGSRRLNADQVIFRHGRMQSSREAGAGCDVDAVVFFYGPRDRLRFTNPDETLVLHRPECRTVIKAINVG
jgi:hypothetical protein